MTKSSVRENIISQITASPYEVISAISIKVSGDISEKKLKSALTLATKKIEFFRVGIYSKKTPSSSHEKDHISILLSSDCESSLCTGKTITKKTSDRILLIPSSTPSTGIFIEKKHTASDEGTKNKNNKDIITIKDSWLNQLADILVNAFYRLEEKTTLEKKITDLNKTLNTSDSIYASWSKRKSWEFRNVKSLTKIGYKKKNINVGIIQESNPILEEDWKKLYPLFQRCITQGVGYNHEFRSISADKKAHWYRGKVRSTEKNSDGSSRQIISISEDVTAIKKSEKSLIELAKNEKWLLDHTNIIFNATDYSPFKGILAALAEYLQADRCIMRMIDPDTHKSNIIAEYFTSNLKSISEFFPNMTALDGIKWIKKSGLTGKAKITEDFSTRVADKRLVGFHKKIGIKGEVAHPLYVDKEMVGYLTVMTCEKRKWKKQEIRTIQVITETLNMTIARNRLLNELRAIDDRYELAMQSSNHGIWDFDVLNNKLFVSPHYFEKLGYKPDEVESSIEFITSLTHPDDMPILSKSALKLYGENHSTLEVEVRQRMKSGEYAWILSRGKVVQRDKKGRALRVTGINTEIGAQKKALKELEEIKKKSVEENKMKSEFLERMSHEIRTPMNAITGMTYLVNDSTLNDEQKGYINNIDSAAQSLLRIIDDILDFSKIESGELTIINESFSLKHELSRVIKLISLRAAQRNNTIDLKISEDIPEHVIGDANRLRQILLNLLSNAIKFTENGSVSISAQIAETNTRKKTCSVLFSISDSGIGLNKEQLKTLFTPFVQAEECTTRNYGGTGLGLSICKNLVEMMGGSIHAISIPKIGTTFHFTINFGTSAHKHSPNKSTSTLTDRASIDHEQRKSFSSTNTYKALQGKHILLVEDNIVNQKVAKGILTKFGLITMQASNGKEALDILEGLPTDTFDAILMDIEMPVLNGVSTTETIRRCPHWDHVPIIAMTAHAMAGDKERYLSAGMNDYIPKPVDPSRLIETLLSAINPKNNLSTET